MSNYNVAFVFLCALSVFLVSCDDMNIQFKIHAKMVEESRCRCEVPQPRVFYLEELVNVENWNSRYSSKGDIENVMPQWTILHRCDSTGCCVSKETRCQPSEIVDLMVTFAIITSNITYFQIPVKNHTNCGCLSTDSTGMKNIK